ncbi:MAG: GNAT family N-acetyltransferase [Isosphaeraceae bacterium]
MNRDIRPLCLDDLPELSKFLTTGFHAPAEADFAAPEVLRWKYLEPMEETPGAEKPGNQTDVASSPRSYLARDKSGRIMGHIGICRTFFEGQAIAASGGGVATIHIIDWLGSPEHRAVGMSLMRRAHTGVATQFGLGVSPSALVVGERAGYDLISLVPAYTRVLRAGYWFRTGGLRLHERALRLARDVALKVPRPPAQPRTHLILRGVSNFGPEIEPIVARARQNMILTRRDPARLNAFLRFPRQAMSGWHLLDQTDRLRGFALLNLVPKDEGRTRTGKIVDCLLDDVDASLWQAAFRALTGELARQRADVALAYASTGWTVEALDRCGYTSRYSVKFHIRDRQTLIPRTATFHLTPLEGDYAYT